MAFADELYKAAGPIGEAQYKHPFVRGIADGTLPEDVFKRWHFWEMCWKGESWPP